MAPLGERLGPFFLQLPPGYRANKIADLEKWLAAWPKERRIAVEVRPDDWYAAPHEAALMALLARYRAGRVLMDVRPLDAGPLPGAEIDLQQASASTSSATAPTSAARPRWAAISSAAWSASPTCRRCRGMSWTLACSRRRCSRQNVQRRAPQQFGFRSMALPCSVYSVSLHCPNVRLQEKTRRKEKAMRRVSWMLMGALVFAVLLAHAPAGARAAETWPEVIALPNAWLPEGVVTGRGPVIYSGSRANGAIYAADLRTGEGEILVPGQDGRVAVGLSFDARTNYIFVAGGGTGKAYVYDADTGALVQEYTLTGAGTFINDVIVTRDAAYFTESRQALYYRIPLGPGGGLPAPDAVEQIPLSGDWQQLPGTSANGIEATPNGKALIIVNSAEGALYYVEPLTGVATRIDLGGESVPNGDGLLLRGHTLYVVQNRLNLIAVIDLAPSLLSGEVVTRITNPNFDVPTTVAAFGNALYAVNARFGTPNTPTTTYSIVRVEARR
jgi:sugar lactone lactonase YvrE